MSSPDKSERSDAPIIELAPKWAGGTYRHGSPDPVKGEQLPSERDLGILRRSVDPEIADFRQSTPRRLGRFAVSGGFIIAGVEVEIEPALLLENGWKPRVVAPVRFHDHRIVFPGSSY
jgi:hypothetical protein